MISILRKETHRVDHDLHWASIGHIRSYPPKGHDLLANLMLSNGSNQLSHGKVRPFPDARLTPRRSRIFVTSASTMHTLMSVLRFGHLLRDGCRNLGTWGRGLNISRCLLVILALCSNCDPELVLRGMNCCESVDFAAALGCNSDSHLWIVDLCLVALPNPFSLHGPR